MNLIRIENKRKAGDELAFFVLKHIYNKISGNERNAKFEETNTPNDKRNGRNLRITEDC